MIRVYFHSNIEPGKCTNRKYLILNKKEKDCLFYTALNGVPDHKTIWEISESVSNQE